MSAPRRVGVDTGGTFTDFVVHDGERWEAFKLPSTPADPSRAVLDGLAAIGAGGVAVGEVVHGSTVATNAALEGRAARVAFVTTEGFRDLLFLGRQARPSLYDLDQPPPPRLVERDLCFEVGERLSAVGAPIRPLDPGSLASLAQRIAASGAESVAVCLLFSYLRPEHEHTVRAALARAGLPISLSSEVLPRPQEYERAVATVLNAALMPIMSGYLGRLETALQGTRLRVMQSSGASIRPGFAARFPVHTLLSGPAAGVVAGAWAARASGFDRVITLDMGGTSTDVAAYDGALGMSVEGRVGTWPVAVPALEIEAVGAGGGSIARRDAGGALQVGPQSAGADPGPACWGRGTWPTVTDAHAVLGWLDLERLAGGRVRASLGPAREAIARLGRELDLGLDRTADGIVRVAEANMARAIWRITAERGRDPRQYALVAFGGAGPLHACALAERAGIPAVVVPPAPGAFSAFGMLLADVARHATRGLGRRGSPAEAGAIARAAAELAAENRADLGLAPSDPATDFPELHIRYPGQSYTLAIQQLAPELATAAFHEEHRQRYGYCEFDRSVEVVAVGVRTVASSTPFGAVVAPGCFADGPVGARERTGSGSIVDREDLGAGAVLRGPAIICESTATTRVPPGYVARAQPSGCLILKREGADGRR